jgi:hypothetical protein
VVIESKRKLKKEDLNNLSGEIIKTLATSKYTFNAIHLNANTTKEKKENGQLASGADTKDS